MRTQTTVVAGDGHLHFYPDYQVETALECLAGNLTRLAQSAAGAAAAPELVRVGLLTESRDLNFFERLRDGSALSQAGPWKAAPGPEANVLRLTRQDGLRLFLFAGRQIVTCEKIEILGLIMNQIIPDGLPAGETIRRISAGGGLPAIPWAPGKWFFRRGKLVEFLIRQSSADSLLIGDSSLRPIGWPRPRLMRLAGRRGLTVIPGSDPLPFPGEERLMGTYGFIYEGEFAADRPATALRHILFNAPAIRPAGRRGRLWPTVLRLGRNLAAQRGRMPPGASAHPPT